MTIEVEGLDLDALEKVARAATGLIQGWRAEGYVIFGDWYASGAIASVRSGPKAFSDARHIATFDPPTVLRLLAALRAQAERVRVLEGEADLWPTWALDIKKQLEAVGVEFDPHDEVNLPAALADWIAGFEFECDRFKARAEAAERRAGELEAERDQYKRLAHERFEPMRNAHDLAYATRYLFDPEFLDRMADKVDCGGQCDTAWREHDTNAAGCTKSESEEGCPFEDAATLRDIAKAIRLQAWALAFPQTALLPATQAEGEK